MAKDEAKKSEADLDYILSEIGDLGPFQIVNFVLLALPLILSGCFTVTYMFAASPVEYRCLVPECDGLAGVARYDEPWVAYAIPWRSSRIQKCQRYASVNHTEVVADTCPRELFNQTIQQCDQFVFKTDEVNIEREFGIFCEENEYKLSMVGTMSGVARFISISLLGMLSDRFGRLTLLIFGVVMAATFGIIKALSTSYTMYIIMEFCDASMVACIFTTSFILALEWMSTRNRVFGGMLMHVFYALGEMTAGVVAYFLHYFRHFLLAIYIPGLIVVTYFWLVPESVRWLLATGQIERAEKILEQAAKANKREFSAKARESLRAKGAQNDSETGAGSEGTTSTSLSAIFASRFFLTRFVIVSTLWISVSYVYYGLSVTSTQLGATNTNKYLSFILVMSAEIPGSIASKYLMESIGRRATVSGAFILTGVLLFASLLLEEHPTIGFVLYILGKTAITCAFNTIYAFSAELWPTSIRNTMLNCNSMVGRIGPMLAPLTPLLGQITPELPLIIFGSFSIASASLSLLLPETLGQKLPDTIAEARNMGKKVDTK